MVTRKLHLLVVVWIFAVCLGLHWLMAYKGKTGMVVHPSDHWLPNELIALSSNKPLLVMFAHPKCPCTRASLEELALLAARAKDRFTAAVVFYEPTNFSREWSRTPLIEKARSIPGVQVVFDEEGKLAKQFAVETSGQTMVYSLSGQLLFSGGITGSRGHLGDNAGCEAVLEILSGSSGLRNGDSAPVFGCEIFEPCATSQIAKTR
jgi:hypothetical protein